MQEKNFEFEEVRAGYTKQEKSSFLSNSHCSFDGLYFKSKPTNSIKTIKAIKESRGSSINFQKARSYSYSHNFRTEDEKKEAKYLLPKEYHQENEYWALSDENGAIKSPKEIFLEQVRSTKRKGGANPKFENAHREAVINLNSNHTMEDLHKVKKHLENKYKFICCAITIHRDEGYLEEIKGKKIPKYNYHAHLNFITYANGKQQWNFNKRRLSEMQSEIAQILGMERGQERSKKKRLAHQHYRYVKEQETLKNKEAEVREQSITQEKKQSFFSSLFGKKDNISTSKRKKIAQFYVEIIKNKGFKAQDFKAVRGIAQDQDFKSEEQIKKEIIDYLAQRNKELKLKTTLKECINSITKENKKLKREIQQNAIDREELRILKAQNINTWKIVEEKEQKIKTLQDLNIAAKESERTTN
ncbi:plasmid recombination protein, partial [Helicobacter sp. faydin-H17]|nr:plasmid recombination protein [Helicobacter kayseriensis]